MEDALTSTIALQVSVALLGVGPPPPPPPPAPVCPHSDMPQADPTLRRNRVKGEIQAGRTGKPRFPKGHPSVVYVRHGGCSSEPYCPPVGQLLRQCAPATAPRGRQPPCSNRPIPLPTFVPPSQREPVKGAFCALLDHFSSWRLSVCPIDLDTCTSVHTAPPRAQNRSPAWLAAASLPLGSPAPLTRLPPGADISICT